MKKRVRIYIEGGAEGKTADNDFRRGWKKFLHKLHELAQQSGYQSLEVVRGKGRGDAFRRFRQYQKQYPHDLCVLLVDAETAVPTDAKVWDVVAQREGDKWQRPEQVDIDLGNGVGGFRFDTHDPNAYTPLPSTWSMADVTASCREGAVRSNSRKATPSRMLNSMSPPVASDNLPDSSGVMSDTPVNESKGWRVKVGGGHAWGKMYCPYNSRLCRCGEFCITSIWSTPKNPANHAKQLRRVVDNCTGPNSKAEE